MIDLILCLILCRDVIRSPVGCSSNNTVCEAHTDNFLGGFGGVASLEDCRTLCFNTSDCRYLTYFDQDGYPAKGSSHTYLARSFKIHPINP